MQIPKLTSTDGKILNNNTPKIYNISGTTTISGMSKDYEVISNDIISFTELLQNENLYPLDGQKYLNNDKGIYFKPIINDTILQEENVNNLIL